LSKIIDDRALDHMIYDNEGRLKDIFKKLILDDKYMMMSITFQGEVSNADKNVAVESIRSYLEQKPLETTITMLSGKPVLDAAIRSSMQVSMKKMMMLAIGIMIIVLSIIFRTRWRLLPLVIIIIAVIGTVGFMGWVNIPITMVSMAVFPILIGLGIDYAIQFQSRYSEEMKENNNHIHNSLYRTVTKMVPAVLIALIATSLGFIALYTSPVPMIQDFGKMLTVGMIISFFVGVFLLIPLLFKRDYLFATQKSIIHSTKTNNSTWFERSMGAFTKKLVNFRWVIILLAFIIAGFGIWVDLDAGAETDFETFMPQDIQALEDIHKLREIVGSTDQVSIVYEGENILSANSVNWIEDVTNGISTNFPLVVVESNSIVKVIKSLNKGEIPESEALIKQLESVPNQQKKGLINDSETKGVIHLGIKHLEAEPLKAFIEDLEHYLHDNESQHIKTTITGKSVLDVEMVSALTTGRYKITLLAMGLVFIGLFVVYRQPVKAFIPLLPIILIIGWSGAVMHWAGINYTPLTATLGALIIGIGTEFTILIMERFYEERDNGKSSIEAISISNQKIGKSIFVSSITTIGGFSALLASDFVILSNFGMMTLINISLALFSTIVVMPAILIILDRFIKVKPVKENGAQTG
jgi:hydrophobe/amphiphile efflux-3 (HAE3) family protein